MHLKVSGAILSIGCAFLSTGGENCLGVVANPFGELGLKNTLKKKKRTVKSYFLS